MSHAVDQDPPRVVQVALNTNDLAGSLRLYSEVLGFANGGANALWGGIMSLQELGDGDRSLMWWMVGRREFFQLEIYAVASPAQAPLPDDWRASDHGWVRFGVAVSDFDGACERLSAAGLSTVTQPVVRGGKRRVAFRDPFVGCYVEILEDVDSVPGGPRPAHFAIDPTVVYATSSVDDLARARPFYADTLGFEILPLETLHTAEDEALWALDGAAREGFVARAPSDDILIEVVEYASPIGRPIAAERRQSDQGIGHLCLGMRRAASAIELMNHIQSAGHEPTVLAGDDEIAGTYFRDPGREFEILGMPASLDVELGFAPAHQFIPIRWPKQREVPVTA